MSTHSLLNHKIEHQFYKDFTSMSVSRGVQDTHLLVPSQKLPYQTSCLISSKQDLFKVFRSFVGSTFFASTAIPRPHFSFRYLFLTSTGGALTTISLSKLFIN